MQNQYILEQGIRNASFFCKILLTYEMDEPWGPFSTIQNQYQQMPNLLDLPQTTNVPKTLKYNL